MEKKTSLYNTELHLGQSYHHCSTVVSNCFTSANQSHAKSLIISKLKAKCKEASEELKVLELREAEIDNKQQILRDLKQTIERNVTRKLTRKSAKFTP